MTKPCRHDYRTVVDIRGEVEVCAWCGHRRTLTPPVCPVCGRAHVVVGLDRALLETWPAVRRHACGVGGPGSGA